MKQETKRCFGSGLSIAQSLCVSSIPRLHDQSWNINLNGLGITSSWRSKNTLVRSDVQSPVAQLVFAGRLSPVVTPVRKKFDTTHYFHL